MLLGGSQQYRFIQQGIALDEEISTLCLECGIEDPCDRIEAWAGEMETGQSIEKAKEVGGTQRRSVLPVMLGARGCLVMRSQMRRGQEIA